MENNYTRFFKNRYVKRSVIDLVTNTVTLVRQIKQMDASQLQAPKPKISEAGSLSE
jgi:hypothetical protein